MTHFSDRVATGDAFYPPANNPTGAGTRQELGVSYDVIKVVQYGAVAAQSTNGICVAATATAAATLSATGTLVSDGVATLDVARVVTITSTSDNSGRTFTISGTDNYGEDLVASIAGPNNATVSTLSAFKTVTSVAVNGAVTGNVSVGSGLGLGLPYYLSDLGKIVSVSYSGKAPAAANVTFTAPLSTTGTPTATTADVRGILTLTTTEITGSNYVSVAMVVDPTSKDSLYGLTPYST